MSDTVRKVNAFIRDAAKSDIDRIKENVIFSERQEKIFKMYYLKKQDIGFIADRICVSGSVIKRELRTMRNKMLTLF